MKERSIQFTTDNVNLILADLKTQTRRIMRPQPNVTEERLRELDAWREGDTLSGLVNAAYQHGYIDEICPYGQPGDRLWVTEPWQALVMNNHLKPSEIPNEPTINYINYLATGKTWTYARKRPAMFMPRWASRITLGITDIRVERLQDISEEDARAEGCPADVPHGQARKWYRQLWDTIYAKQPNKQWNTNPFVWVIEFKKV